MASRTSTMAAMAGVIVLGASLNADGKSIGPAQDPNGGLVYGAIVNSSQLTGNRTVGSPGLVTTDSDWNDAVVSWLIENNGDGTWDYLYTLEHFDQPGISNFVIDFSNDAFDPDGNPLAGVITNMKFNGNSTNKIVGGNKGGMIGSIKFDIGADGDSLTYSFTSNRNPVWGDLFVKGGTGYLHNSGFTNHALTNVLDFVARPNGGTVIIPLPAGVWGGALLLGALAVRQARKVRVSK